MKKVMEGVWGAKSDTAWEFYMAETLPEGAHVSAVMGLPFFQDSIVLVQTRRGWEIPGGHMEFGESVIQCLQRELLEEIGVNDIISQTLFGYRRVINPDRKIFATEGRTYPRETIIPYFLVYLRQPPTRPNMDDAFDARLFRLDADEVQRSHDKDVIDYGMSARDIVKNGVEVGAWEHSAMN